MSSSSSLFVIQTPSLGAKESLLEEDDDSRLTETLKERIQFFSSTKKRRSRGRAPTSLVSTVRAAAPSEDNVPYDSLYQFLQYIKATLQATFGPTNTKFQLVQTDQSSSSSEEASATSATRSITIRHAGVGALVEIEYQVVVEEEEEEASSVEAAESPIKVIKVEGQEPSVPRTQATTPVRTQRVGLRTSPRVKTPVASAAAAAATVDSEEDTEDEDDDDDEGEGDSNKEKPKRSGKYDQLQKQWDAKWYSMLDKVKLFKEEKGHANVPKDYIPDRSLGSWVSSQRTAYKEGRLKMERIQALNDLGFVWSFRTIGQAQDMKDGTEAVNWDEPAVQRKWKAMLERLKAYAQQHGNTRVPSGYSPDPQLAYWVQNQRVLYRKEKLPEERVKALEEIGFLWRIYPPNNNNNNNDNNADGTATSPAPPRRASTSSAKAEQQDEKWQEVLERLKVYQTEFGHTVVPQRYDKDPELGKWVQNQRRLEKEGKLKAERKAELDALNFVWKVGTMGDRSWQDNYERLVAFKEKWGDCLVPTKYEPDQRLASWVMWQRGKYHQNKLPDEHIAKLDAIGFVWKVQRKGRRINHVSDVRGGYKSSSSFVVWSPSTAEEFWHAQWDKLKGYKAKFGHTNVPVVYFEDLQLAKWVTAQRMAYTKGSLSQDKIDKLESLGFVWRLVRSWEDNFERLQAFHAKHGHCNVPVDDPDDPKLGRWVKTQKSFSKRKELSQERFDKLRSLGFEWNVPKGAAASALTFATTHKQTPPSGVELPLDKAARLKATNARLSEDRRNLEAENRELRRKLREAEEANSWEDHYEELQEYVAENGDPHVPTSGSKLGQWVAKQREQYKRGALSQERIQKLEGVGFDWVRKPGRRPDSADATEEEQSPPRKKMRLEIASNEELLAEEEKLRKEKEKLAEAKLKLEEEKNKLRLRQEALQAAKLLKKA